MSSIKTLQDINDSAKNTRLLFDRFFQKEISYNSNQVDAVVGFFAKRGFDQGAAISVATVLLQQAKVDNVNVFTLLDTLKDADEVKLNSLISAILNANRSKLSKVGFREASINAENIEARNVIV